MNLPVRRQRCTPPLETFFADSLMPKPPSPTKFAATRTSPQLDGLGSTSAFRGFIEVNEEATTICLAAQGMFDDTKQREILADLPWITGELKEVIEVAFGCVPGDS